MDFTAGAAQTGADHSDVSHRGELYEDVAAYSEDFILQCEYIRGAFFYKEDFSAAFASAGGVHEDYAGGEAVQNFGDFSWFGC